MSKKSIKAGQVWRCGDEENHHEIHIVEVLNDFDVVVVEHIGGKYFITKNNQMHIHEWYSYVGDATATIEQLFKVIAMVGKISTKLRTVKELISELERYDPDIPVRMLNGISTVPPKILFTAGRVFFVPSSITKSNVNLKEGRPNRESKINKE